MSIYRNSVCTVVPLMKGNQNGDYDFETMGDGKLIRLIIEVNVLNCEVEVLYC